MVHPADDVGEGAFERLVGVRPGRIGHGPVQVPTHLLVGVVADRDDQVVRPDHVGDPGGSGGPEVDAVPPADRHSPGMHDIGGFGAG